jgi:hypothetical protein
VQLDADQAVLLLEALEVIDAGADSQRQGDWEALYARLYQDAAHRPGPLLIEEDDLLLAIEALEAELEAVEESSGAPFMRDRAERIRTLRVHLRREAGR